jgi:hypothetical protein
MLDRDLARIRTHRNNIHRYRRLLGTKLSDLERQFIERRLSEEQTALQALAAENFPVEFTQRTGGELGNPAMSEVRDLLISGSEEVIGRYRLLLAGAKSDQERECYRSRLEQGRRLPDELGGGFQKGFAA